MLEKLGLTAALVAVLVGAAGSGALAGCGKSPSETFSADAGTGHGGVDGSVDTGPILGGGGDSGGTFGEAGQQPDAFQPPPGPNICQYCTAAGGQCSNNSCTITENPGNLTGTVQSQLQGTGMSDAMFRWLYPYDKTVFPRGLIPPTLQFDGASSPDAVYVHVSFPSFDYKGYYGPSMPGHLTFSALVWTAITEAATAQSPVQVQITKLSGGQVSGPITETWTIAQGNLKGTIYYETYDSTLAGGLGSVGIMQIQPGATQPVVIKTGCGNVCHTASADGSTLVANVGLGGPSASYDLKNNAALIFSPPNQHFTYGALYPDGSFLMSATDYRTWFPLGSAALYDSHTGATIAAPGWDGTIKRDGTPAFSPDGKYIAFNHEDTGGGHSLAVMDFDQPTHTFSNLLDIATDPANTVAWPAFTPDGKWIVYHAGSNAEFETDEGATGDLFIVDLATHTVHRLDTLDGYTGTATTSYLPASDPALSFAPTVLPEAVGGYFWIVFTSHRSYGNTLPSQDNMDEYGKLWVAALDLSPTAGQDASHPAFYLDGQETNADNLRGFWVLNPCKADGSSCASGDECCGGFCRGGDSGALTCGSTGGGCSNEYEKCSTAADCCDPADQCINQKCAQPAPQ
jgi:hypothetical protein